MGLELKVTKKEIGDLVINYDEFKQELCKTLSLFDDVKVVEDVDKSAILFYQNETYSIYTTDGNDKLMTLNDSKKAKAKINNVSKAINDRKIELKKEFLNPYEKVEKQAKDLIEQCSIISSQLDIQVKSFDKIIEDEKRKAIRDYWDSKNYVKITLEDIFNVKWLNKGYKLNDIKDEIDNAINKVEQDLSNISLLVKDKDKALILQSKYLLSLDLNQVINDYNKEEEMKKVILDSKPKEEIISNDITINLEISTSLDKFKLLAEFMKNNDIKFIRK